MADVNGDGYLDIYVSAVSHDHGLKGRNELFINNGNSTFTESAAEYGLNFSGYSTQSVFFDYDHDGDLDCYILNQSHKANENIVDTINRRRFDPYAGDRLYRNDMNTAEKNLLMSLHKPGSIKAAWDMGWVLPLLILIMTAGMTFISVTIFMKTIIIM